MYAVADSEMDIGIEKCANIYYICNMYIIYVLCTILCTYICVF